MDYINRFKKRGDALKTAYRGDSDSAPQHRSTNVLQDVLIDVMLRCKAAGADFDVTLEQARPVADQEWYFAEPVIREAVTKRTAS